MSGGYFDYKDYELEYMAVDLYDKHYDPEYHPVVDAIAPQIIDSLKDFGKLIHIVDYDLSGDISIGKREMLEIKTILANMIKSFQTADSTIGEFIQYIDEVIS